MCRATSILLPILTNRNHHRVSRQRRAQQSPFAGAPVSTVDFDCLFSYSEGTVEAVKDFIDEIQGEAVRIVGVVLEGLELFGSLGEMSDTR